MDMQIIDADYTMVDERPVIRIFGRAADGTAMTVFYRGYLPYFYTDRDPEYILRKEPGVLNMEKVQRRVVLEEVEEKELLKVTLANPSRTPEIRDKLKNFGAQVYEADILFKYRFMADLGLFGMGWVQLEDTKTAITSSVTTPVKIEVRTLKPLIKDEDAPLRIAAFDIECTTNGGLPDPKKNEIILLSLVFNTPFTGKQSLVLSTRAGADLTYPDEKSMLADFIRVVVEFDPDIITGFNCNNFDIPYIVERMRTLGVAPLFSRCASKHVVSRKVGMRYRTSMAGRVVLDVYEIVKRDFSLQRYGLEFVASALLKEKKEDVRHSQIEKFWRGTPEEFQRLVNYSRQDSVLVMNLLQKLVLADKYIALSKISGTLLQDTLDGGQTAKIENYVLREFNKRNYIFPVRPEDAEMQRRELLKKKELVGGYVIEPQKQLHSGVVVLDFKSMYPSIIRTFNICPTTLMREVVPGVEPIVSPVGARFYPKTVREGIIPSILGTLTSKRASVKKLLKKCEDPVQRRNLDAQQWAFKILSNAFYGYMGYSRARLYDLSVANSITSYGRDIIQKTVKKITDTFGYQVVYGDTDSVFVKVPGEQLEDMYQRGTEIAAAVNKDLPGHMEMEFEKIFKRFLPLTKKRYAAWKFERKDDGSWKESIETKGIETVRRDWCPLVGDSVRGVIDILLKKSDVKEAVKFFKVIVNDLVAGKTDLGKLVITKTMTKSARNYAGVQPHIELVKKMEQRAPGEAPGVGDRVAYVIIKGTQLISKRTEDPSYVKEKGLQIDAGYYIENQLLPPVERIFKVLNVEKSELLGFGRQAGLFDMVRQQPEELVTGARWTEVTGFHCAKCRTAYSLIPLLGTCSCGGALLFSTARGPAAVVLAQA